MAALLVHRAFHGVALAALVLAGGCTRIRDHKGYVVDSTLIDTVRPGVDNRDSVAKTLGNPTLRSQFDGGSDWYYLARDTRQLAFSNPRPVTQMLMTVKFDSTGNVTSVGKSGLERVASISPAGGKTPTLGRNRSFFQELFGNIGSVGASGRSGGTADNPQ
ncbi:outer membrane protein assembly factor BamE [Sphingomonas naphthae]|uniref:Outer membrane protein assembly factor BamE n=1 Tax=Sphingomonas naphthae TaxID=1813468 RepID=A0ABY7TJ21_9SPHN|nr:outer membrane protein assembly factor BamE [Sphingomonas naphthae]WCT73144.1 outer membrane protein assembly factor BamE [Sphingomonas naphthae]